MIESNPTVSVIIPTYNRAGLVGRAIKSALNQTFENLEIIVVDDASIDNTIEVVKGFNDHRIKYIKHENTCGGSAARNTGIRVAQGDFVALLDDDDEWSPEKVEKQIRKFITSSPKIGLVYCGYQYVYQGKVMSDVIPEVRGESYNESLKRCFVGGPTPLVRRVCFNSSGYFDESLPSCQDWDMWIRIAKYYEFEFDPTILAKVNVHGNQVSTSLNNKILARKIILEKYKPDLEERRSILSLHLRRLGSLCCLDGKPGEGFNYIMKSIQAAPWNVYSYIHLILLLMSKKLYKNLLRKYGVFRVEEIIFYH